MKNINSAFQTFKIQTAKTLAKNYRTQKIKKSIFLRLKLILSVVFENFSTIFLTNFEINLTFCT